jgi:uncharacterized protein
MGGPLFEGLMVVEAFKTYASLGMRPDLFFWRSHDGLEVDLLVLASGVIHPVEFKLTATPLSGHALPLTRFCALAGAQASPRGLVVCRTTRRRELGHGHLALPWQEFPDWLKTVLG